jgi:hypothetical protein
MSVINAVLNAGQETAGQPIIWRLGRLFNVVTNIRRARVTEDYAQVVLSLEGSTQELAQATDYLRALGVLSDGTTGGAAQTLPPPPEAAIAQPNAISVRLSTVNAAQGHAPILYRVGKDYGVVVNIARASFDDEEGGTLEVTISGPLMDVQRAIAYLHTTGLQVNPRQRSVSDAGNL